MKAKNALKTLAQAAAAALVATVAQASSTDTLGERLGRLVPDGSYRIAQSCPYTGTIPCAPGSLGPGGCYNPGYAICQAGMICSGGLRVCAPANGAPAYCYDPGRSSCR